MKHTCVARVRQALAERQVHHTKTHRRESGISDTSNAVELACGEYFFIDSSAQAEIVTREINGKPNGNKFQLIFAEHT